MLRFEQKILDAAAECDLCHGEIYDGEIYGISLSGHTVCLDCARGVLAGYEPEEVFRALGYEVEIA